MAHATARRRSAAQHAPARRPLPRRVSGPIARPVPAPAGPVRRGSTGAFERLRAVADHRFLDRLLRSRLWIWMIGIGLGGIVAMQVSMLKMNAGISRCVPVWRHSPLTKWR